MGSFEDADAWESRRRRWAAVSAVIVVLFIAVVVVVAISVWRQPAPHEVIECVRGFHQSRNHCARD